MNDVLLGDIGSDTYLFGVGDGHDLVVENYGAFGDIDIVKLAGIDPAQVSLARSGDDLLVRLAIQFDHAPAWGLQQFQDAAWEVVQGESATLIGTTSTTNDVFIA